MNSPKAALRRQILTGLPRATVADAEAVADGVLALPELTGARCIAAYASFGPEISTRPLLDALVAQGVRVLLPVLRPDLGLDWGTYTGWPDLVPGARATQQPSGAARAGLDEASIIVVPAVAVDHVGHRLGRGGGSYDRALASRPVGATVVAIVAEAGLLPHVPAEPHDQLVDVVVTPTRAIRCASGAGAAAYD